LLHGAIGNLLVRAPCAQAGDDMLPGLARGVRAQLAAIGCPIVGDEKYGSKTKLSGGAIALHHARLTVIHPISKAEIVIEAPYPEHWPV
jgi:23S rRNA pseudouridine1911/1915/1917 synthase